MKCNCVGALKPVYLCFCLFVVCLLRELHELLISLFLQSVNAIFLMKRQTGDEASEAMPRLRWSPLCPADPAGYWARRGEA